MQNFFMRTKKILLTLRCMHISFDMFFQVVAHIVSYEIRVSSDQPTYTISGPGRIN